MPLRQSLEFSFGGFFEYLKKLLLDQTWGLSDFSYPQTVQYFIFAAFPHTVYKFLLIFFVSLCSLGIFLFFRAKKKEMNRNFSKLSAFLRMDLKKIKRQATVAALPSQALFWSFFSPLVFLILLFFEAYFEIQGLGTLIKIAFSLGDLPLLYGSLFCTTLFALTVNVFFLFLKGILPNK